MIQRFAGLVAIGLSLGAGAVPAAAECRCVANGERVPEGGFACLRLPDGPQLARCDKVLNNPSWTVIERGCAQFSRVGPAAAPSSTALLAP
ncbi:hypothetical protein N1F89_01195 [Aquibium sp. A9E412]|uniref:hypothetical protein n=1 Tax=Aquibium sp. A9E412 TaxID=2976767 RepID=UPI0025B096C8|nr:hypothetical protein [Aquibium sp. A9E412]MDN2564827.1 hypothetical protein [Aquibium sp. A9E412]